MRFRAKFHKNPKAVKDYFSSQSLQYSIYRPKYPKRLFNYLLGECRERELAWDVGTGSGQVAQSLSLYFEKVYATDASSSQIVNAIPKSNINYAVANEQAPALKRRSVNLITVAQALHWFDMEVFYAEADRVLKRYGLIACWSYGRFTIDLKIDREIDRLYSELLKGFWAPEMRFVETGYRSLSFPFRELRAPKFVIKSVWNFEKMIGYLKSWSAVENFILRKGYNPIDENKERLKYSWGDIAINKEVEWQISIRVGHVC